MLETFPENACLALQRLVQNQGRMTWQRFMRRFGVRGWGLGAATANDPTGSRSRPPRFSGITPWWRAPFSTRLTARRICLYPRWLLSLLPVPQGNRMASLGRPATPAEHAHSIPTSDRLLDHACTLLAALRLGLPEEALTFPSASPYLLSPLPLRALLSTAGLIDPGGDPLPEPTAFLKPVAEALPS
jgi:hypothetical protein